MGILSFLFGKNKFKLFGSTRVSAATESNIKTDWRKIDTLLKGGSPSQLKDALITADKTMDNALRDLVDGENMGQRLKNAKNLFEWEVYNKIWKAHKLRNTMVHEAGFEPTHGMITDAITRLRKGLHELGLKV